MKHENISTTFDIPGKKIVQSWHAADWDELEADEFDQGGYFGA